MTWPLWFADLLFWSVQVAVLALSAGILVRILRIREPGALLVCWRTLIGASLLLPFIEPWQRPEVFTLGPVARDVSISTATAAANAAGSHWHFPSLALIAEILGAVVVTGIAVRFVMLALGLLKLRQLRRNSGAVAADAPCGAMFEEARSLTGGRAEFRLSGEVESPVTFGLERPVILLPEKFLQLDARFQAAIACHELLHVRRRDWAHHLGEEVLRAIFWFHPAILWLVARVRLAREQVVDLEAVRLTAARKAYVEALLEFTGGRRTGAIPAPPFLAEQQFVERVALMLKEVRMSGTRLIASLSVIACVVVGAGVLGASIFPLKAAPREAASVQDTQAATLGTGVGAIDGKIIFVDTVKQGTMDVQVRGLGTLEPASPTGGPVAKIEIAESQAGRVRPGQSVEVDTHKGDMKGHVTSISSEVVNGTRSAFIALDSAVPSGVATHAVVEGTIQIAKLENVVYVGRPVRGDQNSPGRIFKVIDNGKEAVQVQVEYGQAGVATIQVLSGLKPGDRVILSEMSAYETFHRLEIKQ